MEQTRTIHRRGGMQRIFDVAAVVLPVIVMMGLGIFARKKQLLSGRGAEDIKKLLMNVCIPALMFQTFYAAEFTLRTVVLIVLMFGFTLAAYGVGVLLTRLLHIRYEFGAYLCTSFEGGMLGYALFILLFGQSELYHFALLDLGNALVLFPIFMTRLVSRGEPKRSGAEAIRSILTPVNVAIGLGILVSVSGLGAKLAASPAGGVLNALLSLISQPTGALILLIVGFGLAFEAVPWSETLRTCVARAAVFAAAGVFFYFLVGLLFPGDALYRYGVVLAFILPPSYAYTVALKGEKESAYAGAVLAIYTVISIIGYCILAAVVI